MSPREHVTNTLLAEGVDEDAVEYALPAVSQWLMWRAEQMRAEGKFGDAVWFDRIANEISAESPAKYSPADDRPAAQPCHMTPPDAWGTKSGTGDRARTEPPRDSSARGAGA